MSDHTSMITHFYFISVTDKSIGILIVLSKNVIPYFNIPSWIFSFNYL